MFHISLLSKSYIDSYMNCWVEIDKKFDMSAADAKKKFKNIRTGYGRFLNKLRDLAEILFPYPKILQALTGFNIT